MSTPVNKFIPIVEAVLATGWSRGTILRRCWAGEMGKKVNGVWLVTLAQVKKVLGMKTAQPIPSAAPVVAGPAASTKPASASVAPATASNAAGISRNQHLVLVLDNSGSMCVIKDAANEMMKTMSQQFLADFNGAGFDTVVSAYLFGSGVQAQFQRKTFNSNGVLYPVGHARDGSTALTEAIYTAIKDCRRLERKDESHLILVVTDGGENSSSYESQRNIASLMREVKATGRYTVTLAGPKQVEAAVRRYADTLEFDQGNVTTWDQTVTGTRSLADETVKASVAYTQARAGGASAVQNFYSVTTDLSAVSEQQVQQLRSINSRFRKAQAEKETTVTDYYIDKVGAPYVNGAVYYQLSKTEKVDPAKEVLLRHKKSGAIYGNEDARKLLGITNKTDVAKVKPGNNAWFDVFVQSTSDNRIIPRGTTVLIDKQRKVGLPLGYHR